MDPVFARRSLIDQSKFLNLLVCKTSHALETHTGQLLGIKLATLTCQGNLSTKLTASPVGLPPTYRASLLSFQREMSSLGLVVARETSFSGPEQRYLLVLVVVGGGSTEFFFPEPAGTTGRTQMSVGFLLINCFTV